MSCSVNELAASAVSMSSWTRRASARSLAMVSSVAGCATPMCAGRGESVLSVGPVSESRGGRVRPAGRCASGERLESGLFIGLDVQDLVELGDLEDVEDVLGDLAEDQLALHGLELA